MARSKDPKKYADRAKMRADKIAWQHDENLLRQEQFKKMKPNPVTGHTELSAQYDQDGNPIHAEPRGYTTYGGH